jgi:predicted amidophosphoribosyltransferase
MPPLCDQLLTDAQRLPLCSDCLSSFTKTLPGSCHLCGLPGTFNPEFPQEISFCRDCQEKRFAFPIAPLGVWFAKQLVQVVRREQERMEADVIVPVPLHRQRARERGFNQVEIFSRPLARSLRLPYRPVLLVRSRPRPEKHLLRYDQAGKWRFCNARSRSS